MIQISVDPSSLDKAVQRIENKVKQGEAIVSPIAMTEIAKAVFTITAKAFLRDLSIAAKSNPHRYHHLYEWGQVGNPSQKLFLMKRSTVQFGNLNITFVPIRSNKPVPIDPRLLEPGNSGRIVTSRHIFRDKMSVIEEGKPVQFVTRKTIVFMADEEMVFVPKGRRILNMRPGGEEAPHSLREFSTFWYDYKAESVVQRSRLIGQIANAAADVMNRPTSRPTDVVNAIRQVSAKYSQEINVI